MRCSSVSRRIARALGGICLVFAIAITTVLAQSSSNTGLTGRVADQTGASIPGATVTLTRVETGERRTVKTDSAGGWEVSFPVSRNLPPGLRESGVQETGARRRRCDHR